MKQEQNNQRKDFIEFDIVHDTQFLSPSRQCPNGDHHTEKEHWMKSI